MSNLASRIWMNVTTSAGWIRPAVGIVRVEQAICAELMRYYGKDRFKQCVWDGHTFVEWQGKFPQFAGEQQPVGRFDAEFPKSWSLDLLRRILPKGQREKLTPVSGNSAVGTSVRSTKNADSTIRYGDILVSVGLDWDHGYSDAFFKLKEKQGIRIITCCYDLIPVLFPQYCVGEVAAKFKEYFTKLTWGSDTVLCISEQTRRDYENLCVSLGTPKVPTAVIPLGDNLPVGTQVISDQILAISEQPFLIFVSTIERRKNHEILYRAYHLLCRRGLKSKLPKLVFVGMPGWGVGDFLKDIELDPLTKGLVIQLNHVNDAELAHLYENALFCLYPSLYEGWGLPVGEALATGKAVVASDQGSLPEVGGDLVRYVDPWNATAWAETLFELINEPHKIKEMEQRVRQNYNIRKWSDTSSVVSKIIDTIDPGNAFPMLFEPGYDMSSLAGLHCGSSILSTEKDGILMFGPHRALPPGNYSFSLEMRATDIWTGILELQVTSALGRVIHARETKRFSPRENGGSFHWVINFLLEDYIDDFEVVCIKNGAVDVAIEGGELIRTEDTVVAAQGRLSSTVRSLSA
jgi:glycosyltransferase involved in cell wall biosynthesis